MLFFAVQQHLRIFNAQPVILLHCLWRQSVMRELIVFMNFSKVNKEKDYLVLESTLNETNTQQNFPKYQMFKFLVTQLRLNGLEEKEKLPKGCWVLGSVLGKVVKKMFSINFDKEKSFLVFEFNITLIYVKN